jgi:hypothetical protein
VKDGAHTHHPGPTAAGIGTAVLVGAGLALGTQAAHAVATILAALLLGLVTAAGLALAGLIIFAVLAYRRRHVAHHKLTVGTLRSGPDHVPLAADREVVSLRQAITELQNQFYATRAALPADPRPGVHEHLHFHGLDPAQVAAILAASRRQAGDGQ